MEYYDCVIIDSGVNCMHPQLKIQELSGLKLTLNQMCEVEISENFQDVIGHGTAVYSIIKQNSPKDTTIFNINIFDGKDQVNEKLLVLALSYVFENIQCKVINVSLGLKQCQEKQTLYNICKKIYDQGTLILAAFDNEGAISYPAAFDCVIGVDSSEDCLQVTDYEYIDNSVINLRAKGGYHKVFWLEPEYAIGYGSSYSCAYMSANVLKILSELPSMCNIDIDKTLKDKAKKCYGSSQLEEQNYDMYFNPQNVVLFPVNKEIHSLIAYNTFLQCNIYAVADIRQSGNVGKQLSHIIKHKQLNELREKKVMDYECLNWEEPFDTIILGHMQLLEKITKQNIVSNVIQACIRFKKNLISLDDLSAYTDELRQLTAIGCKVYFPKITYNDICNAHFGKLFVISSPVLCVAGTSSSQGKFSLQLELREKFQKDGYNIGQLGTEPTSLLYGMDEVFHYGYSVENNTCFEYTVLQVNHHMQRIDEKNPDIILTGVQSGIVPYLFDNISYLTHRQMEVLTGIIPDAIVLCINPQDDIEYIRRTILAVENFLNTSVLCCALYPMKYSDTFLVYSKKEPLDTIESQNISQIISEQINIPVFPMNDDGIQNIYETIINFFSE